MEPMPPSRPSPTRPDVEGDDSLYWAVVGAIIGALAMLIVFGLITLQGTR